MDTNMSVSHHSLRNSLLDSDTNIIIVYLAPAPKSEMWTNWIE